MATQTRDLPKDSYIIPAELAIKAMRDSGYRNTAYALAELIDNSVQAKASLVEVICIEDMVQVSDRRRRRLKSIGVLDDGTGMGPELLRHALQFGYGTHLDDRSAFAPGDPGASFRMFGLSSVLGTGSAGDLGFSAMAELWPLVFGIAAIWLLIGYFFNDSIIHLATGAKQTTRAAAPLQG